MELIFAAPPQHLPKALAFGCRTAVMSYRVGQGFRLYRQSVPRGVRGSVMSVSGGTHPSGGSHTVLAAEIIRECIANGYSGVALDLPADRQRVVSLVKYLSSEAKRTGIRLYVTEPLAPYAKGDTVLIGTAISGGTLKRRLEDALASYGLCAITAERVRMDFALPAKTGEGRSISAAELDALRSRCVRTFFSPELCTNYFTYRGPDGAHFVLYDDEYSIAKKLELAESLGIKSAFFYLPDVSDIAEKLIRRLSPQAHG